MNIPEYIAQLMKQGMKLTEAVEVVKLHGCVSQGTAWPAAKGQRATSPAVAKLLDIAADPRLPLAMRQKYFPKKLDKKQKA